MRNERWHDHMDGWDVFWMPLMMLVWAAVIGAVVWGVITLLRRDAGTRPALSPREELDRKLVRGEIGEDEYARKRELLGPGS